jgi:DNA-binding NtrC family response regulator
VSTILVMSCSGDSNWVLAESLEKSGHTIIEDFSVFDAVRRASNQVVDVLFINESIDGQSLQKSVAEIRTTDVLSTIPLVVITKRATTDDVIEVMKLGAFEHLHAPVSLQELESVVNRAVAKPKPRPAVDDSIRSESDLLLGPSSAMRKIEKLIGMAASCEATVLIMGETGTGKDTVARAIHKHSVQTKGPLTVIDCTAVPEDYGAFRSLALGSQGSVILDEVGDLNAQMQAMLVRALKEVPETAPDFGSKPRIVATTQYNLIDFVKEKKFREDLFYRLNVLPIHLPPLRDRGGADILAFAELFLFQAKSETPKTLSSGAAKLMLDYEWPGNVRELQNLMYHLTVVVPSQIIEEPDVSMLRQASSETSHDGDGLDYYSAISTLEKRLLIRALQEAKGSRAEAARLLGINRQLLYTKMKSHGLEDLS